MDTAERALLDEAVRGAISGAPDASAVDGVLAELGWLEMLQHEPRDAIAIVFTALGAANANAAVLDDVLLAALGHDPNRGAAVLLPRFGTWEPPGDITRAAMRVHGLATARAARARELAVVARRDGALCSTVVDAGAATIEPVHGADPELGLCTVHVETDAGTVDGLDEDAWTLAVATGQRAVSHQIAGATRSMLALACAHAVDREQFGRPIASFQAVRHRLAEALVAIEGLDAALVAAWDEPGATTAALAKVLAGRAAATVGRHCQQVLAGVGFTTEHPFHRFLKRTIVLEGLFGSADELAFALGRSLLAVRDVPTLVEL